MRHARLIPLAAALAAVAAGTWSCATKTVAPTPADTTPTANSPANAVKVFEWAMNHKSSETIRGLLTDDFMLIGTATDSAGNPSRGPLHGPGWFLDALAAMDSASTMVTCLMDANPVSLVDSRPGKAPKFHKQVRSSFDLRVRTAGGDGFGVTGNLLFFVTRGDSAAIPAELKSRGVRPDSSRWWFDRLEDETLAMAALPAATLPAATEPSRNWTFAALLELFYALVAQ